MAGCTVVPGALALPCSAHPGAGVLKLEAPAPCPQARPDPDSLQAPTVYLRIGEGGEEPPPQHWLLTAWLSS